MMDAKRKAFLRTGRAGLLFFGLLGLLLGGCIRSEAADAGFRDTRGHWAADAIGWGVAQKIVNGYEDGGFRPDQQVTEAEFLAMLLRAFPVAGTTYLESLSPWYGAYFTYAQGQNWPVETSLANEPYARGEVARLIAATQGQQLETDDAIRLLLQRGLSSGKTSATVEGFGKTDFLTRAEALQFIHNLSEKRLTLSSAPPLVKKPAPYTVRGIAIGDLESSVTAKLGQPQRKDRSEYPFQWYIYNSDYASYAQIGVYNGQVVALYSNAAAWATDSGLQNGSSSSSLQAAYGSPLQTLAKGNVRYSLPNTDKEPMYELNGSYVTFFLDAHEGYSLSGILVIRKDMEQAKSGYYPEGSEELRIAFERELLDLANVERVKRGKRAFAWDDKLAGTARGHSQDMALQNYFDHVTPAGVDLGGRLRSDQVSYRLAAENIAAGQRSAMFAHSGWMNSTTGHREAILGDTLRLGVGVYFGGELDVYYTENFITPR